MMRIKLFVFAFFLLPVICWSCDKDPDIEQLIDVEKETVPNGESDGGTNGTTNGGNENPRVSILNFLGDSIIDYWNNVDDYFPEYECHNYGWSAKGINTFLGKVNKSILEGTECVVEIGTNDMRKVINDGTIDSYVEHYVDVLISLKAKRIYLLSLLPRNRAKDGGFDFNSHYPEYNKIIESRVTARMNNVVYIPIYDLFLKNGKINMDYSYDGLHPNTKGYEIMAKRIREYLIKE